MDTIKTLSVMCALAVSFAMPMTALGEMESLVTLTQSEQPAGDGEEEGPTSAGERQFTQELPPEKPEGMEAPEGGQPPEMPEGMEAPVEGQLPDGQPPEAPNGMGPGGFGGSGEVNQGETANLIDADGQVEGESYTSDGDDENALRIDGATVTLKDVTVNKSAGASSNTEDGDFYGMNAALLATNGAQVTIENGEIRSAAQNGNGIFSYGEGTVVDVRNTSISTEEDNSGGIQTAGGGTTYASNLTVETQGRSSAAIRSDRGGGTVQVEGGSYTTSGTGSPAIYSTADITVSDAVLSAANSEAVVVEGQNSVTLENCAVSGSMAGTYEEGDENIHNIMLYQSMSGDAEVGAASFTANGGSISALLGDMFYVTNTRCQIKLSDVDLQLSEGNFLTVAGNSGARGWGTAGANGGQAEVVLENQLADGNITVDTVSTLNLTLSGATQYTGSINIVENAEGGEAVENNAVVVVEENAVWNLTGDSTITSLENNGTVNTNGYTLTVLQP